MHNFVVLCCAVLCLPPSLCRTLTSTCTASLYCAVLCCAVPPLSLQVFAQQVHSFVVICCAVPPLSLQDFDEYVRNFAASHYNMTLAEVASKLPRIYTSSRHLSELDFMRVYKVVDALAIPTHGEGWGRPQMEAMAMGLPVITTNW